MGFKVLKKRLSTEYTLIIHFSPFTDTQGSFKNPLLHLPPFSSLALLNSYRSPNKGIVY